MAVYITGDIHGSFYRFMELKRFCKEKNLGRKDWIICLGDVGLNYFADHRDEVEKRIVADIPVNFFCIHGNHEFRPSKKSGYHTRKVHGDIIGRVWWDANYPNQFFAIDGEVYKIIADHEEFNALVCGGAYSVDKEWRTPYINWWPDEQPNEKTKKKVMEAAGPNIDFVLTHTCPTSYVPTELFLKGVDQSKVDNSTEEFLEDVLGRFKYNEIFEWNVPFWYFGHFHGNKYADDYVMLFDDIIKFGDKVKSDG